MKIKCRPNGKAVKRFKRLWAGYYGYHCAYCTVDCTEFSTIDHLIPLSKGGGNTLDNMVIACYICNVQKGNKNLDEFKPLVLMPINLSEVCYVSN